MKAVLISTYELGHQPFGLASPASWLSDAGIDTTCVDLSLERIDKDLISEVEFIGFYLPMHTATRIAVPVIEALRELNPTAHLCAFGLYAPMNSDFLRRLGMNSIIGGEFETELVELVRRLKAGVAENDPNSINEIQLIKQTFRIPERQGLPGLSQYAHLVMPDESHRTVGYTEATRGCKYLCRHCPIVPVYGGRFMIVQQDVVLKDIDQQIEAGAQHITFGDPDFFNGVGHSLKIVDAFHEKWPDVTYDVTIKVEHLVMYAHKLSTLKETGCLFVTTAVEAVDDEILVHLDKGHSHGDFVRAVALCRDIGIGLNPTFVAFTPWTTISGYRDLLRALIDLELVTSVSPVQFAIRLLIPRGSRVLELDSVQSVIGAYDEESLCYPWENPDRRVDDLQQQVEEIVEKATETDLPRTVIFEKIWEVVNQQVGGKASLSPHSISKNREPLPYLSEPWYCCAEPTNKQLEGFI